MRGQRWKRRHERNKEEGVSLRPIFRWWSFFHVCSRVSMKCVLLLEKKENLCSRPNNQHFYLPTYLSFFLPFFLLENIFFLPCNTFKPQFSLDPLLPVVPYLSCHIHLLTRCFLSETSRLPKHNNQAQ